ncbi:DUF72 domain-containing protein [Spongiactinospora gelatinilytica]|uniref:DUF72 domain-containing protein n=1 Tax=Spongiactinospora gelatinilytica TaxID=2666298 RepID=A0A2W2F5I6_9ACTN|nr:DUF72 domain-containing protein [Spongiactinospora gelatinilytica]PZG32366.1 DUF72 domain-containing protein [Spongiactinospora gelatinilytica]
MRVFLGTSGWQYADWRGVLYPEGMPARLWLERYAQTFGTVENNNSFYRLPSRETFASWRERTPEGFVMAVKASRYLTHTRRLKEPREPVERLLGAAEGLGDRLGPILLQLPPTLRCDLGLLTGCLACFPPGARVAVEPRHPSWWEGAAGERVRAALAAHGATLCWADRRERALTPLWRTAPWGYLRLHEGSADPWPSYGDASLARWITRLGETWKDEADQEATVYVYFNNDPGGAAVRDAARFAAMAGGSGHAIG